MPDTTAAIRIVDLAYRYGDRQALAGVSFDVQAAEIFALLGPNGSGKTTMFRILSTLVPLQDGRAEILGLDLRSAVRGVRESIGVVFQAPSLDIKLTVDENLAQQAATLRTGTRRLSITTRRAARSARIDRSSPRTRPDALGWIASPRRTRQGHAASPARPADG